MNGVVFDKNCTIVFVEFEIDGDLTSFLDELHLNNRHDLNESGKGKL